MRLLIVTQKVDKRDPLLGFFHRWIEEFAKHCEFVTVICLEIGEYHLPVNVKVLSLGKERNVQNVQSSALDRLVYIFRFYKYIWKERKSYDSVFVHMNQEYILLGWKFWKLWGKKIFLWRNHAQGTLLTRLAVLFSNKVFCTSPSSYTARFKKTVLMPAGIDTDFFRPDSSIERVPDSVLFLGRISPVKKVLEFIDWVKGTEYTVTIAGPILPEDKEYGEEVKRNLTDKIKFIGPVTQEEALRLYQTHEIYVNKTPAGSFDKTILEAAACEMGLIVENDDLKSELENKHGKELREFVVQNHSLERLTAKLAVEIS